MTAAQNGCDPLTHYWLKAGKNDYRRLCDDAPWAAGLRYERDPRLECSICCGLHDYDRLFGWSAFSLTYTLRGIFAPSRRDMLYIPDDGLNSRDLNGGAEAMKPVSMTIFAQFYVAGAKGREGIVERLGKGGRDYYGPLTTLLRQYFKSGDIEALRHARPNLNPKVKDYLSWMKDLERAKQHCIKLWTSRQATYFKPHQTGVSLGELTVRVNPEIGMITADGDRILKLWYPPERIDPTYAAVFYYLLNEANRRMLWGYGESRIWDVHRQAIPIPPALPDDMAQTVMAAAEDFMRLLDLAQREGDRR